MTTTDAVTTEPSTTDAESAAEKRGAILYALALPGIFVMAWIFALTGAEAPGSVAGESGSMSDLRWILYFTGFVFCFSSVMHSVFAKKTAASIGWQTNGFQKELAAVSLGLGLGCFYAVWNQIEAMVTISIPVVAFLALAGLNHVVEMVRKGNYAPNNTLILIWDFGISISLVALLVAVGQF